MCVIFFIHLDHKEKAIEFSVISSCMIFHSPLEKKKIAKALGELPQMVIYASYFFNSCRPLTKS
jgi:hypothetical protein